MRFRLLIASLFLSTTLRAADPASTLNLDLGSGVSLPVVLVPKGTFMQGSPIDEPNRGPDEVQRFVNLTQDFYLGKTAVTIAQWQRFAQETGYRSEAESGPSGGFGWDGNALTQRKEFIWRNPGFAQTGEHPVTIITYPDAEAFCQWLGRKIKRKVTLPSEAQWEYACRAGTTTAWHNLGDLAGSNAIAWHKQNAGNQTHPASSMAPNPWGLNIGGNAAEWCLDWYSPYEPGPVTDPIQTNPNLSDKPRRVLRGGSWARDAKNTRSAARFRSDARSRNADIGFRILCSVEEIAPTATPPSKPASTPGAILPRMEGSTDTSVGKLPSTPTPPQSSSPKSFPAAPSAPPEGGKSSLFTGLVCMACPVIVLALIVFLVVRSIKARAQGAVGSATQARTTGALAEALQRSSQSGGAARIRIVDDGFWLLLELTRGTSVHYSYRPQGGMDVAGQTQYQPGPEGQFVFTGARPESVRVTEAGGVPMDDAFSYDSDQSTTDRGNAFSRENDPPRYPSAY